MSINSATLTSATHIATPTPKKHADPCKPPADVAHVSSDAIGPKFSPSSSGVGQSKTGELLTSVIRNACRSESLPAADVDRIITSGMGTDGVTGKIVK